MTSNGTPRPPKRSFLKWLVGSDLSKQAVVLHLLGDALNDVGVIIASLVMIYGGDSPKRFYADPAVSMLIAIGIFCSALPLLKTVGLILLGSPPPAIVLSELARVLSDVPGVHSIHDLQVWRLDQDKVVVSAHIVMAPAFSSTAPSLHFTPLRPRFLSTQSAVSRPSPKTPLGG